MAGFKEVAGHERLVDYFRRTIQNGNVSQAYLLTGEDGIGKMTLARAFAMALQCEAGSGGDSCGKCHSCKQFMTDNHPDVIYIKHEKPASIGVDEVREQLVTDSEIRPYQGPYKIYIIDEAEKLTVQAQNALLKTIEEPPSYVVVLFLATHENSLLNTILSRCITLQLRPLPDDLVRSYLMDAEQMGREEAQMCAAFARGNLGKAIRMAQSETFTELYKEVTGLLSQVDKLPTYAILKPLKEYKEETDPVLELFTLWFRDVEVYKASGDDSLLILPREREAIARQAAVYSYRALHEIQKEIGRTKERLKANVGLETALEVLLLTVNHKK